MRRFIERLFVLEAREDEVFYKENFEKMLKRGLGLCIIIVVIEAIMLTVSYMKPELFYLPYLHVYRIHYITLFIAATLAVFIAIRYKKNPNRNRKGFYRFYVFFLLSFLLWAASISMIDQAHSEQITVYSTFVILIGAGALIEPLHLFVMYIIAELAFVIGLPYFQEDPFVRNSIIVNSLIFVIFTFFFARQVYVEAYSSSQKDQTIKRQNEQLQKQYDEILVSSQIDCMTGLYNRFSLNDMIQDMWEDALDKNQSFTVFMCDIDDFKVLNDTHGHIKGDECITKVGKILRNTIESHKGLAFRYGGDEFLLAIKGIDTKIADKIKEELREKVENIELIHDGKRLHVSVSVGKVSRNPQNYDGPWDVIHIADKEMYKSKARKPKQSKYKQLFCEISKKWKNLSCYTR